MAHIRLKLPLQKLKQWLIESRSTDYPITIPHISYKQTVKDRILYCMYTNKMLKVIMTTNGYYNFSNKRLSLTPI